MGCCGPKRDILRRQPAPTPPEQAVRAPPLVQAAGPWATPVRTPPVPAKMPGVASSQPVARATGVTLEYTERARILVRGPATGRTYEFSAVQRAQTVEAADAPPLLRTGFFRRT
jgi:hypothetical protein